MNTTPRNQNTTQRMKQYIVDVPEPKNGQIPGPGGLRENGKMAVQYKNPREYKEPVCSPVPVQSSQEDMVREEFYRDAAELLWSVNDNFVQPLFRDGLRRAATHIIGIFDDLTATPRYKEIIDDENTHNENKTDLDEDDADDDDSKITKFPGRRVS